MQRCSNVCSHTHPHLLPTLDDSRHYYDSQQVFVNKYLFWHQCIIWEGPCQVSLHNLRRSWEKQNTAVVTWEAEMYQLIIVSLSVLTMADVVSLMIDSVLIQGMCLFTCLLLSVTINIISIWQKAKQSIFKPAVPVRVLAIKHLSGQIWWQYWNL